MFAAFLLSKLLRNKKKIPAFSTTKPAVLLQYNCLFLRRISSNTSCAQRPSQLSSSVLNPSASAGSVCSKRLGESSTVTKKELNRDYTVSYLIQSCGLSPKDAASASEKIHFATPERPNTVLDLLRNQGFTKTQMTTTVRKCPKLLLSSEKIILPKFEFLLSMGLSRNDLTRIISYSPSLLTASLKNMLEPICNFVKTFVHSDRNVCSAIKRTPGLLLTSPERFLVPNIAILQENGVLNPSISHLLTHYPHLLVQKPDHLSAVVIQANEMGFDPSKSTFVLALNAMSGNSKKLIWDRSYKIYFTKWGWSEEDILSAFKKHPHCMIISEKKLNLAMEYLVNTMGWSAKCIAQNPTVILFSLKKRIIPRCSVIRVLWRKGLLSKDLIPSAVLMSVEKVFLKRFVTKYEEQVPQLLSVYKGEMDAQVL